MKHEIIHTLTHNFESHANQTEDGTEFWLARDLQHLLEYTKWDNFLGVIYVRIFSLCHILNNSFFVFV